MSARLFCEGRAPSAEILAAPALVNYGHFSTMQGRAGAVRGFDLHLQRLDEGTRTLFGSAARISRVMRRSANSPVSVSSARAAPST